MLQVIFEDRFIALQGWFEYLRTEVKELETATGMLRAGREMTLARNRRTYLANRNNMLKQQHAVRTELAYCETILTHIIKFGTSCKHFLKQVEEERRHCGHEQLKNARIAVLDELLAFTLAKCDFTNDKLKEVTSRIEAQINVVSPFAACNSPTKDAVKLTIASRSALWLSKTAKSTSSLPSVRNMPLSLPLVTAEL
jgi:hypothetical protein